MIDIRVAGPSDAALLAEIGAETFAETYGSANDASDMHAYVSAHFSPALQARELADPANSFLVAEAEGTPAGFARLRARVPPAPHQAARPIEIVHFYARAAWIGRGVGAQLMQGCLDEAVARGADLIWLGVWERNPRAIRFYEKWAFLQIGKKQFQVGTDVQDDLVLARAPSRPPR